MKELILGLVIGALSIIGITAAVYDIRDREKCTSKGGIYAAHECFKKDLFIE